MLFSLIYYPKIEHEGFHAFRNRYEPFAGLLREHVPFIFPLPDSVGREQLDHHIEETLKNWDPIRLHFCELGKTNDHWLFLTPSEGREQAVQLHDELYTGMLKPYLREDLPYTVHIGLGLFSRENYDFNDPTAELQLDDEKYDRALSEFKALQFEHWCTLDRLTLVEVNEDFTNCRDLQTFALPS